MVAWRPELKFEPQRLSIEAVQIKRPGVAAQGHKGVLARKVAERQADTRAMQEQQAAVEQARPARQLAAPRATSPPCQSANSHAHTPAQKACICPAKRDDLNCSGQFPLSTSTRHHAHARKLVPTFVPDNHFKLTEAFAHSCRHLADCTNIILYKQACSNHACWYAQESAELQVRVAAQTVNRDDIVRMTTERCGPRSPGNLPLCETHSDYVVEHMHIVANAALPALKCLPHAAGLPLLQCCCTALAFMAPYHHREVLELTQRCLRRRHKQAGLLASATALREAADRRVAEAELGCERRLDDLEASLKARLVTCMLAALTGGKCAADVAVLCSVRSVQSCASHDRQVHA